MNPILRFIYIIWFIPIMASLTGVAAVGVLIANIFSERAARYITNAVWARIVLWPGFFSLEVSGLENLPPGGGFIVYANHTTLLDIPTVAMATGRQVSWVAKKSLAHIPFFGWALKSVHMLVSTNGSGGEAKRMVAEAGARLAKNQILAIFPEGTRNRKPENLLPFKKGTFMLAKHSGAKMLPVAIKGGRELWPPENYLPSRPGKIRVKIGAPITPAEGERLGDLCQRAQDVLQAILRDDSW